MLIDHQKAKHFKCGQCQKRLNTAGGLAIHMENMHKLRADKVPNAVPGRDSFDIEIFGMEGVPEEAIAERRAGGDAAKRARTESSGDAAAFGSAANNMMPPGMMPPAPYPGAVPFGMMPGMPPYQPPPPHMG